MTKQMDPVKKWNRIMTWANRAGAILLIYSLGGVASTFKDVFYPKEYVQAIDRRKELSTKIGEWQRYSPLMREPFSTGYQDSLANATREFGELNSRIRILKQEQDNKPSPFYSWATFFMD